MQKSQLHAPATLSGKNPESI